MSALVVQSQPAHLFLVAVLLRFHEVGPLFAHRTLVESHVATFLSVAIAVPRSSSQPSHLFHALDEFGTHAQSWQFCTLAARVDGCVDNNRTVGKDEETLVYDKLCAVRCLVGVGDRDGCTLSVFTLVCRPFAGSQREVAKSHVVVGGSLASLVVGGDSEGLQGKWRCQHRLCAVDVGPQFSVTEGGTEVLALHGYQGCGSRQGQFCGVACCCIRLTVSGSAYSELLVGNLESGYCPFRFLLLCGREAYEVFCRRLVGICYDFLHLGQCHVHRFANGQVDIIDFPVGYLYAVFQDSVTYVQVVERALLQFALQGKGACHAVLHEEVQRLVYLLHVVTLGSRRAVGQHHAVTAEVAVVGVVAKVTSVGPVFAFRDVELRLYVSLLLSALDVEGEGLVARCHTQALVLPVPYELSRHSRIFLIDVEKLTLVAHRVTHGVGVLTLHVRSDASLAVLIVLQTSASRTLHRTEIAVHRAGDRTPCAVAFVVSESGGVEGTYAVHHSTEVVAATALVTCTPDDDGGMVAEGEDVAYGTFHHSRTEGFGARKSHVAVTLYVGFCQHVQTQSVAQVIEIGIVGIVTGANAVHVEAFHLQQVVLYLLLRQGSSAHLAKAVSVYPVEDDAIAVHQQSAVLAHAYRAETNLHHSRVGDRSVLLEFQHQVVELRCFGTPCLDARYGGECDVVVIHLCHADAL